MNKSVITLAVLSLAAVAQAAPQANTFYAGAKAGWASFHDGIDQLDASTGGKYGINRNSVTYGVFGGYQILNQDKLGLAAELGYDYFGRVRGTEKPNGKADKKTFNHTAHGTTIALKPSYEVLPNLDVYGKTGIALVNNRYKTFNAAGDKVKTSRFRSSFILGAGVEYAILPELAAHIEYQWLNNAGKVSQATLNRMGASDYRPDISSVSAGLSYRFGQGAAPIATPEVVSKNFAFSSDVLFAFGKSNLRPEAAAALDATHTEIQNLGLANPAIQVNGYTDRIGKEAANLKLSQRRAETVANYLVSRGLDGSNMTAVGYGEANPVTGNTCDAVKGRKALIACLAPDRRVEIQVQGSKDVAM